MGHTEGDFQILNANDSTPVPYVHVVNYTSGLGATSDLKGRFRIYIAAGDTLLISSIGFYLKKIIIEIRFTKVDTIYIEPRIYNLDPIIISRYRTYDEFKTALIKLKLPETRLEILRNKLKTEATTAGKDAFDIGEKNYIKNPDGTFGGGVSFTLNFPTKEDIQRKELLLRAPVEIEDRVINEKFNSEIVKEITGLREPYLSDFILFCNFSQDFLFNSSQYDILMALRSKFSNYKSKLRIK